MAIRYIPAAAASSYIAPSTPPKRKGIDLEQLATEGLNIALASIPAAAASSSAPLTLSPTRTRSYSNLKPLAKGGQGAVSQALSAHQSPVACKVTSFSLARHEQHLLNTLSYHRTPHSLRCRDLCDPNTHQANENSPPDAPAMLVTDLIPAKNLHQAFLKSSVPLENRLKRDEIITIFKSLLQYLAKLCSLKIIHRDLKPGNMIYLRSSRQLTVIDLGYAIDLKLFARSAPSGQSPDYQAPESILEDRRSLSIDLWSAGCILFEMLTDQQLIPFDYKTPRDEQNNHLLQMIAARIGKPSPEYLKKYPVAKKYFDETLTQFTHPLNTQLEPWEKVFEAAAERKQFSAEDKAAWKSMLRQLLTYTRRSTAEALLRQESIFSQDTCFHLTLMNPRVEEIRVIRANINPTNPLAPDFSTTDLVIRKKQLVNHHCLHIPRDAEDEYFIYYKETTNSKFIQPIKLEDKCFVKLEDAEVVVSYSPSLQPPHESKKPRKISFEFPSSSATSPADSPKTDEPNNESSDTEDCFPLTQPDIPTDD